MKSTSSAAEIAKAVNAAKRPRGPSSWRHLARIEANNGRLGAFTDIVADRAMAAADKVDADGEGRQGAAAGRCAVRGQESVRPHGAGDPRRQQDQPRPIPRQRPMRHSWPARGGRRDLRRRDSTWASTPTISPARMRMTGASHNPHELAHMTGGSSAGSAAAVASGHGADGAGHRTPMARSACRRRSAGCSG